MSTEDQTFKVSALFEMFLLLHAAVGSLAFLQPRVFKLNVESLFFIDYVAPVAQLSLAGNHVNHLTSFSVLYSSEPC